jgi:hypothetical protein
MAGERSLVWQTPLESELPKLFVDQCVDISIYISGVASVIH